MTIKAIAGITETFDVEEQMQAAQPWEVSIRQMSPGKLHVWTQFLQVNSIILYREHWSNLVMITGATPEGYFVFGGPSVPEINVDWCGKELGKQRLAYAQCSTEIDLIIPNGSDHCALLVPKELLLQHLDEASRAILLAHRHHIECNRESGNLLIALIQHLLNKYPANCSLLDKERVCKAIETQLLEAITQLFRPESTVIYSKSPVKRRLIFSRAIEYSETLDEVCTVSELAAAVDISQRVLELAFHEALGVTPLKYLHWQRLNLVRRELINTDPGISTVTEVAGRWGFSELGRFAVEYKRLFHESPSTTLNAARHKVPRNFLDSLL